MRIVHALVLGALCIGTAVAAPSLFQRHGFASSDPVTGPVEGQIGRKGPTEQWDPKGPCLPQGATNGARIVALGAYEGGTESSFALGESTHDTGVIAVGGNSFGAPLVLVLSAYDPVVWDLRNFPTSRLRAVLVYGYHNQAVAGLPAGVPLRVVSHDDRASIGSCGPPAYAYEGGRNLEELAESVEHATERKIDAFAGAYGPEGLHAEGGSTPSASHGLTLRDIRSAVEVRLDGVAPKEAGVQQLLSEGALREPTPADRQQLNAALTRASPTGHLAPVRAPISGPAYVVTRAVTLPKGMYGAHLATFLIPPNVPKPIDPGSHNTYYYLEDGRCEGALCSRE